MRGRERPLKEDSTNKSSRSDRSKLIPSEIILENKSNLEFCKCGTSVYGEWKETWQ